MKNEYKQTDNQSRGWNMFSTSKEEVHEMLVSPGIFIIMQDCIIVEDYPFQPSVAYKSKRFAAREISNIDLKTAPPTLRIGDELIFVPADKKEQLAKFATANNVPTVEMADIWDWLLEPFLDTEYSEKTHKRLTKFLATYRTD